MLAAAAVGHAREGPRRRGRGRTDTPLAGHRLLRPARLPFRHSPAGSLARGDAPARPGPASVAGGTAGAAALSPPRDRAACSRNGRTTALMSRQAYVGDA